MAAKGAVPPVTLCVLGVARVMQVLQGLWRNTGVPQLQLGRWQQGTVACQALRNAGYLPPGVCRKPVCKLASVSHACDHTAPGASLTGSELFWLCLPSFSCCPSPESADLCLRAGKVLPLASLLLQFPPKLQAFKEGRLGWKGCFKFQYQYVL